MSRLNISPLLGSWTQLLAVVGGVGALAWPVRLAWTLTSAAKSVRDLPTAPVVDALARAARQAQVQRIRMLDVDTAHAFCAGTWRPTIFVGRNLVARLGEKELLAMLWHEACHARRRDPLRRAAYRSAADVLMPVSLVRWWTERRLDRSELQADGMALHGAGRNALAGALWATQSPDSPQWAAGLGDAGPWRVAPLLGDQPSRQWPPRALWISWALGILFVIVVGACAAAGASSLL